MKGRGSNKGGEINNDKITGQKEVTENKAASRNKTSNNKNKAPRWNLP